MGKLQVEGACDGLYDKLCRTREGGVLGWSNVQCLDRRDHRRPHALKGLSPAATDHALSFRDEAGIAHTRQLQDLANSRRAGVPSPTAGGDSARE